MKDWEGYPPDNQARKGDERFYLVLFDDDGNHVSSTPFERGTTTYSLPVPMDWMNGIIQQRVFLAIRRRKDNMWMSVATHDLDHVTPGTRTKFSWGNVAAEVDRWRLTMADHPSYQ